VQQSIAGFLPLVRITDARRLDRAVLKFEYSCRRLLLTVTGRIERIDRTDWVESSPALRSNQPFPIFIPAGRHCGMPLQHCKGCAPAGVMLHEDGELVKDVTGQYLKTAAGGMSLLRQQNLSLVATDVEGGLAGIRGGDGGRSCRRPYPTGRHVLPSSRSM
jgi:hypothetical protein